LERKTTSRRAGLSAIAEFLVYINSVRGAKRQWGEMSVGRKVLTPPPSAFFIARCRLKKLL